MPFCVGAGAAPAKRSVAIAEDEEESVGSIRMAEQKMTDKPSLRLSL